MQAFEVMGTVDENGQLVLDQSLEIGHKSRVKVIILVTQDNESESDPDDTPVEEIKASLRRALKEMKSGQTRPLSELWERIDD
jgi:hypothetical protein